jgi:hypothetical protein
MFSSIYHVYCLYNENVNVILLKGRMLHRKMSKGTGPVVPRKCAQKIKKYTTSYELTDCVLLFII